MDRRRSGPGRAAAAIRTTRRRLGRLTILSVAGLLAACSSRPAATGDDPAPDRAETTLRPPAAGSTTGASAGPPVVPSATAEPTVVRPRAVSLSEPTVVRQNTPATNDLSPDGYTWAQGNPLLVDQHGKLIAWAQRVNGGLIRHVPVVSNDAGATWAEPTRTGFTDAAGEGFSIRPAAVYDPAHDRMHVCWVMTQADGGVYYRCYSLARDLSNNVVGVARVRQLQLEAGTAGMTFEAPFALWCADVGALLLGWGAVGGPAPSVAAAATRAEARLTMRRVTDDDADLSPAGWAGPFNEAAGVGSTDALGSSGLVRYSCLARSTIGAAPWVALGRKSAAAATHARDLVWFHIAGGDRASVRFNRATWSAATGDWRGGPAAPIADDTGLATLFALKRAGTDAGYGYKYQLISQLAEDTAADRLWIGCSTWKSDAEGDTWTIASVDGSDAASAPIDVYVAGAASTDPARDCFVTGDLIVDPATGLLVVAYTDLMRHDAYLAAYRGRDRVAGPLAVYTATPVDVPTLYPGRIGSRLALLFRDFNPAARSNPPTYTPPYTGFFVTVALA